MVNSNNNIINTTVTNFFKTDNLEAESRLIIEIYKGLGGLRVTRGPKTSNLTSRKSYDYVND